MRADFAGLFNNVDIIGGECRPFLLPLMALDHVREMQSTGQPRRANADDENIRFELFALDGHKELEQANDWTNQNHCTEDSHPKAATLSAAGNLKRVRLD